MLPKSYRVGRVPVSPASMQEVCSVVENTVRDGGKGYICVSNMRTVTIANKDDRYFRVMENSILNTPDGRPLVWCGRAWGLKEVDSVLGPDIFERLLTAGSPLLKHFFLGDTQQTLDALSLKCREEFGLEPAGMYSPPFAPLESYDIQDIADRINNSGATLVWTSLRAPKQDFLAEALMPLLNDGIVMIGVGAAFRFMLGEYKMSRGLIQRMGFGGFQVVRNSSFWNETKWYFKHTGWLIRYIAQILWRRFVLRKQCDEL
ncbi:MAG: WecB/TagA/CpsF family glycosyltransferase [Bacteroidales bacterium]|nr:WecB/TagA/CpsF family glycosyltransferase [Bacteroidales bacterium]